MREVDLTERPTGRSDLEGWYAAALAEQESSGLSVREFADELGVPASTLYQWRRKLAASVSTGDGFEPREPTGLVEVTVEGRGDLAGVEPFVVHLASGRSVEVPCSFDDAELRRLVAAVESC